MVAPYAGAWIEMMMLGSVKFCINVAPYAGAWIEMPWSVHRGMVARVAPYAGAWIEMAHLQTAWCGILSLPTRERGLKYTTAVPFLPPSAVAPCAGAWIEIICSPDVFVCNVVAPYAGAWIEIVPCVRQRSVPSRRSLRGSVD